MALLICPSACRLRRLAQNGPGARHFSCKFSHKRELVKLLLNSLLRGPCVILYIQVLNRRSCRDPFSEVLPWKILQVPCLRGACMKALVGGTWVLVSRSCKIRYSSSRSFYDDLVRFFQGSWHEEELGNGPFTSPCEKLLWRWHAAGCICMILCRSLVRRFWRGPGEIL